MKIAVFPGSFDPFTIGHREIVESALQIFDKVIVAVGYNSSKKGFLTPQERVEIIGSSLEDLKGCGANIEVISYTGLTVDLCRERGAQFIVRGIRTASDFEMESGIAQANKKLSPEVSTIFLTASAERAFISSTIVRDVVLNGGNAQGLVCNNIDLKKYLK